MKFKTITLLALAALVSMACGGKDNPVTPSITISGSRSLSVPAEGAKEFVTYVMNGSVTTSEEDEELLEDYAELTVECDNATFSVTEI